MCRHVGGLLEYSDSQCCVVIMCRHVGGLLEYSDSQCCVVIMCRHMGGLLEYSDSQCCVVIMCRHVGGLLEYSDSQCCVVEDSDMVVIGYVITCPDVSQYYQWFNDKWLPSLRDKYPKLSANDSDSKVCVLHSHLVL